MVFSLFVDYAAKVAKKYQTAKENAKKNLTTGTVPRVRLSCAVITDYFLFRARSMATAMATVAPTIGLLPMPRKPIISTCAGTDDEPAN